MQKKFFPLIVLLLSQYCILYSQQYPVTHYTKDRDLPGNQVLAIFQDSKGYMWFSTSKGLYKYNGREYKSFISGHSDRKSNGRLKSNWQFDITEDSKGSLWISDNMGVDKIKEDKIYNWVLKKSEDRFGVYADKYERVWVYSTVYAGDLYYFLNDSLYNFSEEYNFKNQAIVNITEDQQGGVYFLTRNGKLFRFFTNNITEIFIEDLESSGATFAFFDSNNNFILCSIKGVGFIQGKELLQSAKNTLPALYWIINSPVSFGLQSRSGKYWFASRRDGLFRVSPVPGKDINSEPEKIIIKQLTKKNGLLSNIIFQLCEDYEGNIWIGHPTKGVSKLSSLTFRNYGSKEGMEANAVLSVMGANGEIFCATEDGIFRFSNNQFERIDPNNKASKQTFMCLLPLSLSSSVVKNSQFLLGSVNGLFVLNNQYSIQYLGLDKKVIRTLSYDHSGRIWIGTHHGLVMLAEENKFIEQDFNLANESISKICEINNKDLYVGTEKGLFIVSNGTLDFENKKTYSPDLINWLDGDQSLLLESINDIIVDTDSSILVATRKGLAIINKNHQIKNIEALHNLDIVVLYTDSKKQIWAGTSSGLFLLQKRNEGYKVVNRYSNHEGLASNEFTVNNTIYEDLDGRIYFGSYEGLTVYEPSEEHPIYANPKCYIIGLQTNDTTYTYLNAINIRLPQSQSKISFLCEGLSFYKEEAVKYEYYLHPIEKEWSNTTYDPSITYGYLESGEFTFYVRTVNQYDITSEPQSLQFQILAPFWKQLWFIFLAIIILVYGGYRINQYRQAHILKRNLLLEKMVKEKTTQIEDKSVKLEKSKIRIEEQYKQLVEAQKELVEKRELEKAHNEIQLLKDKLAKENIYLREKQGIIQEVSSIIGRSTAIQEVRKKVVEIANTDSTVFITGETGVGKNLVAEAIHDLSSRKERALITVNCAAIPESLVESELFGHERGAFTGAAERREGKFEVADGSTIFLDEIGDMPLNVQAKVLNVLQSRSFSRVGGNQQIKVDVRIIAATNHDLSRLVEEGKFRQDLFYRINIYSIHIPNLKDRPDDIEPIAKYFIDCYAKIMNKKITAVTKSALNILENYSYPGNIRELENIIHRSIIICKSDVISDEEIIIQSNLLGGQAASSVPGDGSSFNNSTQAKSFLTLEEIEKDYIKQILASTNGKISGHGGAAEILGLHPNTLRSRMEKLGIVPLEKNL